MREQLWRYYPQMLELADDLAADWFLDFWNQAPTPAKAVRLRQTTIERFVKAHRLRRWQAPEVLRILKQKPLSVAPEEDRSLCHALGAPQVQADASPDQGRERLVRPDTPGQPNPLCSLDVMSWQRPNIGSRVT